MTYIAQLLPETLVIRQYEVPNNTFYAWGIKMFRDDVQRAQFDCLYSPAASFGEPSNGLTVRDLRVGCWPPATGTSVNATCVAGRMPSPEASSTWSFVETLSHAQGAHNTASG